MNILNKLKEKIKDKKKLAIAIGVGVVIVILASTVMFKISFFMVNDLLKINFLS